MEPLTALALAGNVMQFVEFTSKLISRGCELYKSTDGRLAVDEELRLIAAELKELIERIQSSGVFGLPSRFGTSIPVVSTGPDSKFKKICSEATKIAEAILDKLEARKLDKSRNRKVESFKRVWSQIWSQGELDALFGRLSMLKKAIDSEILTTILSKVNELNLQTLAHVQKSDHEAQLILKSVLESTKANNREVMAAVARLTSRMDMFRSEDRSRTRDMIMEECGANPTMLKLDAETLHDGVFTLSQWKEKTLRKCVNNSVLHALNFEMRPKRYETVFEAHPKTFEWAAKYATSSGLSSTGFSTWLQNESGLYWISGKPGSGKSTLMKHILDDERTKEYLEMWAQQDADSSGPLIIASFFFWNSGTLEQRSQMGMLRSLLFQVFEQEPKLIPIVLTSLWLKQYGKYLTNGPGVVWTESWTLSMLMTAFKLLTKQQEVPCKIFFLIDGLDEFEGDQELLAELFNDISKALVPDVKSSIKLCVSSRPYVVFQENFEGCPMLKLQDLTLRDITWFVSDRFLGNGAFNKLAAREPQATNELIDAVVSKSGGVFLWVFIVVKDLLKGIRNRDTIPDLWRRLDALPPELEPLYHKMMSQIDPIYLVWASKVFQLIRTAREVVVSDDFNVMDQGFLTISELYFTLGENFDSLAAKRLTQEELNDICLETEYHITARCVCFLEVAKQPWLQMSESHVQYLHRTAKDFLEEPSRWATVLDHTKNTVFDPSWSMLQCKSFLVRRFLNTSNRTAAHFMADTFIIMLALAMRIDSRSPFYNDKISVLDGAEDLLSKYHVNLMSQVIFASWYADEPEAKFPRNIRSSLFACALALDFTDFVDWRLSTLNAQDPAAGKLASTLMIRGLATGCDWGRVIDLAPFENLHMKMAMVLVQQGADLNALVANQGSDITIWRYILSYRSGS
ncbi:hypothetical protein IFR05_011550 [Cadophora sp. M221]|nr:hypothetical protein IFR05_011550 [Cadophora sp. M221]